MTDLIVRPFKIKQHDLEPPLEITCSGSTGDVNGVSSWKVIGKRPDGTVVFTDTTPTVVVVSTTSAKITHAWIAPQTDTPGKLWVEAQATWPGTRPQTFPPEGFVIVLIEADLG
jgi:hypothetical protein